MGKSKKTRFEICPNCSQALDSSWEYCPVCGQSVYQVQGSFRYLISEISGNLYSFDSKLFRTIRWLFTKPGLVASEYVSGKMASYVPPVRLYIFVSLLLLFSTSLSTCTKENKGHENVEINVNPAYQGQVFTKELSNKILSYNDNQLDSFIRKTKIEPGYFNKQMVIRMAKISMYGLSPFIDKIKANATLGMFLLMPLSALILRIFYRKKRKLYFDHLIAALYMHTAIFILFILNELTGLLFNFDWFLWVLVIFYVYFIWSLRNFYNTKWKPAIWRSIPIVFTYFVILLLYMVGVTFTSFLTF
ncbi:MAG TPA: DUF3667 domain-containing protein [Bacteroidales bacterium]|nr:DUF3667 domain-containing protein [Bacteroidales bacterium]